MGLVILAAFAACAQGTARPRPALVYGVLTICWLIWLTGLAFALLAMREDKSQRRFFGRVTIGMVFSLLFIGYTVLGVFEDKGEAVQRKNQKVTPDEAQAIYIRVLRSSETRQKAAQNLAETGKGELALVAAASTNLLRRQIVVVKDFYSAWLPLTKGHLLNMSGVTQPEELEQRQNLVRKGVEATQELADFVQEAEQDYRRELIQRGVSTDTMAAGLQAMHTNMLNLEPLLHETQTARLEWAQSELAALDLLRTNWGAWDYDADTRKVTFHDESEAAKFNRLVKNINRTSKTMQGQQEQMLQRQ